MREIIIHRILNVVLVLIALAMGWWLAFNTEIRGVVFRLATQACAPNEGLKKIESLLLGLDSYKFYCNNGMRTGEVIIHIQERKETESEVEQSRQLLHSDVSVTTELPSSDGGRGNVEDKASNIRGHSRKKK